MSEQTRATTLPKAEFFDQRHAGNLPLVLPVAGALALVVSFIWGWFSPAQFAYSWLFAFGYFFTLIVGCLFWVLVHHATDAEWSVVVRRILENVAWLIPVLALFFIPVIISHSTLFKWWNIPVGVDETLDKKRGYLNHEFFWIRMAMYFLLLSLVAWRTRSNSVRQDADGHPQYTINNRKWAFFGLPVFAITLTFGAFDWFMGLDYRWFSTMWGVYIFAGTAGSGMCVLVLLTTALRSKGYLPFVTMEHYHIMGKWMLAFCVFWGYIGFSQYMLYWYGNIPEETSYFIRRNVGTWWFGSTFLVFFRFFVPFAFLLMQNLKKKPRQICFFAGWILFMQMMDIYIVVMPMLHHDGIVLHPLDLLALVAIGAPLAFIFIKNLGKSSLFPVRDPRLELSLKLKN